MAGHSHWAGIKHKKGRQDKIRSKIFSKISREIMVAAKIGSKDPDTNHRLRAAIESAKEANMPKENIKRAINKSDVDKNKKFENLRYEGFGPKNIAVIIESLTDNKNRTAANIRTILQKFGGNLGGHGTATHFFENCGVIQINREDISEEKVLDFAASAGAKDCVSNKNFHEIITEKDKFYKVKNLVKKLNCKFFYSAIEWRPRDLLSLDKEYMLKLDNMLEILHDDDDVQKVFHNCKLV